MLLRKKGLSLVMTGAMVIGMFAGMTTMASADTNPTVAWSSSTADTSWYNTTNTEFTLSDAADLAGLAILVNGGNDFSGKTVKLSADVDTTDYVWPAIGYKDHPFAGTFNGQGHSVTIYVYSPNNSSVTHKGIFGSTTSAATVRNVASKGVVGAYRYAGGIVGYNAGLIECCYNEASITGNDSGSRGSGGIAGVNIGTIQNCYNAGTVYNLFRPAGGITGIADSSSSNIQNCYNVGSVTSSNGTGWAGAIIATLNSSTVNNCYYLSGSAAHAVAYPSSTSGVMSASAMQASSFATTLNNNIGSGATTWTAVSGDYPKLSVFTSASSGYTISLTSGPTKTSYNAGETFDPTGIVITATPSTGSPVTVTNYVVSKTTPLYVTDTSIILSGDYNGTAYSFSVPITVAATLSDSVYLDGTAATNGNGTSGNPFNDLTDAVNQAVYNNLGVTITGKVTISGTQTLHPSVTFTRGTGCSGSMFEITGSGQVIFTSATLNGNGAGTIFDVSSGKLVLRGGVTLTNCATAVNVQSGATVEVNKASITATNYSIYNAGSFILNDYGNTSISGNVYLASGKYIEVGAAVPNAISVTSAVTNNGTVIAKGINGYSLTSTDLGRLSVSGYDLELSNNQVVINDL